jgi:hypothetical protein
MASFACYEVWGSAPGRVLRVEQLPVMGFVAFSGNRAIIPFGLDNGRGPESRYCQTQYAIAIKT